MTNNDNKKQAIITGSSRGIGEGIAKYFAKSSYNLALVSNDDKSLNRLKKNLEKEYKIKVFIYNFDMEELNKIEPLGNEILKIFNDKVDVLVNNSGIYKEGFLEHSINNIKNIIDINLISHIILTKVISNAMKKNQSGYIFNMCSRSGKYARPELGLYATSKYGLSGFNEALYEDMMRYNVKVSALFPSVVDTQMNKHLKMRIDEKIPISDVVSAIEFLIKLEKNAYIKELVIDCRKSFLDKKIGKNNETK